MINRGGEVKGYRKVKTRGFETFDRLPRSYKELLWNAPVALQTNGAGPLPPLKVWQDQIQAALHKSCLATYGPDHPQAYAPKIRDICLEDLDL